MEIPSYIAALLQPQPSKPSGRKVWSIDLETVWLPFLTATSEPAAFHVSSADMKRQPPMSLACQGRSAGFVGGYSPRILTESRYESTIDSFRRFPKRSLRPDTLKVSVVSRHHFTVRRVQALDAQPESHQEMAS